MGRRRMGWEYGKEAEELEGVRDWIAVEQSGKSLLVLRGYR